MLIGSQVLDVVMLIGRNERIALPATRFSESRHNSRFTKIATTSYMAFLCHCNFFYLFELEHLNRGNPLLCEKWKTNLENDGGRHPWKLLQNLIRVWQVLKLKRHDL